MKISGPYTLPDSHAAMIGRVSDAWAQLEFQIDRGIWTLLRTEHQLAACVTAQLNFIHPRIKAFIALVEVQGGDTKTITDLNTLYSKEMSALSESRNRSVHDPRMLDKDSKAVHRLQVTAKPKTTFGWLPEPLETLSALHDEIYRINTKFCELRDRAILEIEALPPERRPQLVSIVQYLPAQPSQKNGT